MTMTEQRVAASRDGRGSWNSRDDVLSVEGVSVRLGGREVLHDVRFAIQPGEFVG